LPYKENLYQKKTKVNLFLKKTLERMKGIEPSYEAWEATALPLSYIRLKGFLRMTGRGERIRTSDILLPKQARYRAALRPDIPLIKTP